jgi:hypothetical protein
MAHEPGAPLPRPGRFARLREAMGLDFHVVVTLMFRGWSILAGAITMLVLPLWLTPVQQGYYYTFGSILAMQIFFELGLNQILVQLVSHEVAHLSVEQGGLAGEPRHLDRLASLVRLMRRWYGSSAVLFAAGGGAAGLVFFSRQQSLAEAQWLGPWLLLVAASSVTLYLSPKLAMLEGTGRVGHVARLRLVQSLAGYAGLWASLYAGAGLWAVAVAPLAAAAGTGYWLRTRGEVLRQLSRRTIAGEHQVRWRHEVFPLQWRIALSWVSGYFIFNLFTPLVFSRSGAVEAGRLGMAMTVFNAVSTIGMSWVNARSPNFTMHIARGERQALNMLFRSVAVRSSVATTALALLVLATVSVIAQVGAPAASRIAAPAVLACLAWVTVVNSVIFAVSVYMRAHREEPMLAVSIVTAALTAAVAWFGSRGGVLPMMAWYAVVVTVVPLPWSLLLFSRYARRAP